MAAEEELIVRFKGDSSSLVTESAKSTRSLQDLQKSYLNFSSALEKSVNPDAIRNLNNYLSQLEDEITSLGGKVPTLDQLNDGFRKITGASMQSRYAVLDLGHIIRDLPYAMSNPAILAGPFDRMTQAIITAKQETGSFKGALTSIMGSLSGGGGILIGIELATTAIALFGQKLFEGSDGASAMKEEIDRLTKSMEYLDEETKRITHDFDNDSKIRVAALKAEGANSTSIYEEERKNLENKRNMLLTLQEKYNAQTSKIQGTAGFDLDTYNIMVEDGSKMEGVYKEFDIASKNLVKVEKEFYDNEAQIKLKGFSYQEEIRKQQEAANKKAEAEAKRHLAELLRLEKEELAEHLKFLKEMGLARTKEDFEGGPDQFFKEQLPKAETPFEKYLKGKLASQPTQRSGVPDFTGNNDWQKGFQEFLSKAELIEIEGKLIGQTFKSAFQTMFSAINAGKPVLQAFFDGIKKSVEQLIEKLAEAAAEAAFLSLISGGAGAVGGVSFFGAFKSLLHFSQGGLVPGAGNGDTVPAMLTPGEYIVPKDQVSKVLQLLGASSSNLPIASTSITSGMSGRQFRSTSNNSDSPQIVGIVSGNDILLLNTRANGQKGRLS